MLVRIYENGNTHNYYPKDKEALKAVIKEHPKGVVIGGESKSTIRR